MKTAMSRPFTLADAMVLIVAIGVGLAITRHTYDNYVAVRRTIGVDWRSAPNATTGVQAGSHVYLDRGTINLYKPAIKGWLLYGAEQVGYWPGPVLAALSAVTWALGRVHRPLSRLARRPGAFSAAASLGLLAAAVRHPQLLLSWSGPAGPIEFRWIAWWLELWSTAPQLASFAVAVAWAVGVRRRAVGGWLGGLDWVIGLSWVFLALLDLGATWYRALPI